MKTQILKKLIKEAVREAIKEELGEILSEAITPVSRPQTKPVVSRTSTSGDPIMEMLNMTQQSMTRDDFRNVMQSSMQSGMNELSLNSGNIPASAPAGPQPGLDISKLDFVKNAGAIYKKAKEKDNFRVGG